VAICPAFWVFCTPGAVSKVAISESRIIKVENGQVFFRYRKPNSNRFRTICLEAGEFIRLTLLEIASNDKALVRPAMMICPIKTDKAFCFYSKVPILSWPGDRQFILFNQNSQYLLFPNG